MAKTLHYLSILCLLLATPVLQAQDLWSGAQQVVSVQVLNQGGFIVNLDAETNNDCSMADGTSSFLVYPQQNQVTTQGAKALLSSALIAFSTGNKLNIMYSIEGGYCWGQQILLTK